MSAWLQRARVRTVSVLVRHVSRLPGPATAGGGAIAVGLAVVFVLAAGGVTAHSSMTGSARMFPAGAAGPVPRPGGPGGPGGTTASPSPGAQAAWPARTRGSCCPTC